MFESWAEKLTVIGLGIVVRFTILFCMDQGGGKDDLFLEFGQVRIFKVVYYIIIFIIKFIPYTVLICFKEIELFLLISSPFPSRIAIKLFIQRWDILFAAHLSII